MQILVLQHERVEHPGRLREFLGQDGHRWTPVHLNEGEVLPSLEGFDALWVLGGPMDVWETDKHPWLVAEKAFIREAVEVKGLPYLGLRLGHQLLTDALGGSCGPSTQPEIGVMDVQVSEAGTEAKFFDDLPTGYPCLQWHSAEVKTMPPGAKCLATSPACAVQAMSWGPRAHSVQFHLEVEADTVRNWAKIPAYENALISALGPNGADTMEADCNANMADFARMAERVYINWLQTAAKV